MNLYDAHTYVKASCDDPCCISAREFLRRRYYSLGHLWAKFVRGATAHSVWMSAVLMRLIDHEPRSHEQVAHPCRFLLVLIHSSITAAATLLTHSSCVHHHAPHFGKSPSTNISEFMVNRSRIIASSNPPATFRFVVSLRGLKSKPALILGRSALR